MTYPHNYEDLPLRSSVDAFAKTGRPLGHFLTAILSNDLRGACDHADHLNMPMIPVYVAYLYNKAPAGCWGSREIVNAWIGLGGLDGINAQKKCPECGHAFQGNGWDGIDAHWRAHHEDVMPYPEAWELIKAGKYKAT